MGAEFTHILDSLGWAVLHSVWQGALALIIAVILRATLRGRSPALRHGGEVLILISCLGAFIWTFALYLGLPKISTGGGATSSVEMAASGSQILNGFIAPFDPDLSAAGLTLSRITPFLACFWALGFAVMSLRYAFAFGQVQQLRTLGVSQADPMWVQRFKALAREIGVSDRVRLLISSNVPGPLTLGLFKPVVLVPVGFLSGLPIDQVEAILRHELAHIRRFDYALNLLQMAVKTVLFYHPAIHVICRWADQDREQACDDLAVKTGRDPLILARGLAALRLQANTKLAMAATGTGRDMPLMERLSRLAGQNPKRNRPEHMIMSLLSAAVLSSVYLSSTTQAKAHPVPPTLPDSVVLAPAPVPPLPPVPPALPELNPETIRDGVSIQAFVDRDKAISRAYAQEMERYAVQLEAYLKTSGLDGDDREDLRDHYVDKMDDIVDELEDAFEDRREAVEEIYEAHIGRKHAEKSMRKSRMTSRPTEHDAAQAEIEGLTAALHGIEAAERETRQIRDTEIRKEKLKALKQARKDIEKARQEIEQAKKDIALSRKDIQMRQSQAETARSFAEAKAWARPVPKPAHTEVDGRSQRQYEAFRDEVMTQLVRDGLISDTMQTVRLTHPNGSMHLNGEALQKGLSGKYCKLWDANGFKDDETEVIINPDSLSILTDWKNGQHSTRITYGTFTAEKTDH